MAKFRLCSYNAEYSAGAVENAAIIFDGSVGPFPPRMVEAKTAAEALEKVEEYKADAAKIGKPLVVMIGLMKGERSPNGFKAMANKFWAVNVSEG